MRCWPPFQARGDPNAAHYPIIGANRTIFQPLTVPDVPFLSSEMAPISSIFRK